MRKSRVLRKLRAGEMARVIKMNLADPRVAEIAALAGFDCVWTDMEHVANDWSAIESQIWAAKSHDVDVLVRVARGSYSDYARPLEMDAAGIMAPHVMNLAEAREIVRMTKFQPIGRRPVDGGNADSGFTRTDFHEYLAQANEERFVVFQIEDPEAMDDLDAIAALDGVDMLFFGPTDFSHGLGVPGQYDHPDVMAARKRVAEAALAHGKFAGTALGPGDVQAVVDEGYRFVNFGADIVGLRRYFDEIMAAYDNLRT